MNTKKRCWISFLVSKISLVSPKSPDASLCQAGTSIFCSLMPITIILDLDLVSTLLRFFQGDAPSSSNLSEEKVCEKHENVLNGDEDSLRGNSLAPNVSVSERQFSGVDQTSMDINVEEIHIVLDFHNKHLNHCMFWRP